VAKGIKGILLCKRFGERGRHLRGSSKALNKTIKRNADPFPEDFYFLLTVKEKAKVVTNCDHLRPPGVKAWKLGLTRS